MKLDGENKFQKAFIEQDNIMPTRFAIIGLGAAALNIRLPAYAMVRYKITIKIVNYLGITHYSNYSDNFHIRS